MKKFMKVMKIGNQYQVKNNMTYDWNDTSTYIKHPPFFEFEMRIKNYRTLRMQEYLLFLVIVLLQIISRQQEAFEKIVLQDYI